MIDWLESWLIYLLALPDTNTHKIYVYFVDMLKATGYFEGLLVTKLSQVLSTDQKGY